MSEKQNNETLCDFIRGLRLQADELAKHLGDQHTFVEQKKQLADHLDQIRMRMEIEQAKLRGNSAAMREALSDACYAMFNFLKTQSGGFEEMANALDKAKAALAAPARNCDMLLVVDGPADNNADKAWLVFKRHNPDVYFDVPGLLRCIDWLFASATEKEGGAK